MIARPPKFSATIPGIPVAAPLHPTSTYAVIFAPMVVEVDPDGHIVGHRGVFDYVTDAERLAATLNGDPS